MTNLKLVATVAVTAVVTERITRFKINRRNQNLAPHYRNLIMVNELLLKQVEDLAQLLERGVEANGLLNHQNQYLIGMLDAHNVPVTEFDRIAMNHPIENQE